MNKYKALWAVVSLFLVIGTGVLGYRYFFGEASHQLLVEQSELSGEKFLTDKQAVIYFSTTADQDLRDDGMSYAVFVDQEGQARALEMEGLELGSMAKNDTQVFLEEKDKVRIVGEHYAEFPMSKNQYTGERAGFLAKEGYFVSIYNTGFDKQGKGYLSDVRYGNQEGFHTATIPHYIATSGIIEDQIYILTLDQQSMTYELRTVDIEEQLIIHDLARLEVEQGIEVTPEAPVLADERYFYLMMSSYKSDQNKDLLLYRINKATLQQDVYLIARYAGLEDVGVTIPYNMRKSAVLHNGQVTFVNGLGDVYTFDTATEQSQLAFSLANAGSSRVSYSEEVYFQNGHLYYFSYHPESSEYTIVQHELSSGKLVKQQRIDGLEELMKKIRRKGKRAYSYDFMMLQ